jgi:predicted cupin superfamily sugar epimerase
MSDWKELVRRLHLQPHPEGGFFRETYRSAHSTAIFYLIQPGGRSGWHRLTCDELFHFYSGGPMTVLQIFEDGRTKETVLSPENPQLVVKAGTWFGAHINEGSPYSLVGCTVAPPFEFKNFEMIKGGELANKFPAARDFIARLRD